MKQLHSKIDESVNFIWPGQEQTGPGYFEARYVRRTPDYFVCYLSSQKGCKQACRMCHLTITGQTNDESATDSDYSYQAEQVFQHYDTQPQAKIVHFGFMARGEPLANNHLTNSNYNPQIFGKLSNMAVERGLFPRYCISTIMPEAVKGRKLHEMFRVYQPDLYYSIYSMNSDFRRKWLNHALPPMEALGMLVEWQSISKKIVKLHWAFIKGQNDGADDVRAICKAVKDVGLRSDFNIVRYNPHSEKFGAEADEVDVQRNAQIIRDNLPESKVKVITRVGFDVKASCGMFVEDQCSKS